MDMSTATDNPPTLVVTLPPGRYVVGDPCYSIADDAWMEWLEAADYTNKHRDHILAAPVRGRMAVGIHTAWGDGIYYGSDGSQFPVDAGLIGLVPIQVADKNDLGPGRVIIDIDHEIEVYPRDDLGVITLGPIEIETDHHHCSNCNDIIERGEEYCDYCEEEMWEEDEEDDW